MKHLENFESYNESKSDMKKIKKEIKDIESKLKNSDMKKPSAQASGMKQQISKLKSKVEDLEKELDKSENTSEDFYYEEEMEEENPYQDGFDAAQEYNVRGVHIECPYDKKTETENYTEWWRGYREGSFQPPFKFKRIA